MKTNRTFSMLKPDSIEDGYMLPILNKINDSGFKIIALKYKKIDNPYNSYYHMGLPPSPINNPSKLALNAALSPLDTNKIFLYFVADGTGGHVFSETLRQHRLAIRKIRNGY